MLVKSISGLEILGKYQRRISNQYILHDGKLLETQYIKLFGKNAFKTSEIFSKKGKSLNKKCIQFDEKGIIYKIYKYINNQLVEINKQQ